jgi:hypothetical protein
MPPQYRILLPERGKLVKLLTKRQGILLIFSGCLMVLLPAVTISQSAPVRHPDGILGKPNGYLFGQYASVSGEPNVPVYDLKIAGVQLNIPALKNFTLSGYYFMRQGDTSYHNYGLSFILYIADPLDRSKPCNPDGPVGGLTVSLGAGGSVPDKNINENHWQGNLQAAMPISEKFTLGAGVKIYQKDNPRQVEAFYGIVNFFPAEYEADQPYSNPDGIEGSPAFLIKGGGSKRGIFGQMDLVFPLEPQLTLVIYTRGERIPSPYVRTAIFGLRIHFYPGNI